VLGSLMVCHEGPLGTDALNCGQCEKCLRTRAALEAAGASGSFETPGVSAADLRDLPLGPHPWAVAGYWAELAGSYPILSIAESPKVETVLINQPNQRSLGAGEASQGPTVAAIANAIANATGKRLRELPFTPERVKAALG